MPENTYNGWTNYETWAIGMFLDGNYDGEGMYHAAQEMIREAFEGAVERDGIWTLEEARKFETADAIEAFVREQVEPEDYAGIRGDLLGAALSEVDWEELAESKTAEMAEELIEAE